jgi:hypothetical protein
MKVYKRAEAKKWHEQSEARKQTKRLVKDSFGEEYNKANRAKKDMAQSIKQKKKGTMDAYKADVSSAKSQLKQGKISKAEYSRLVKQAKNKRTQANTQWKSLDKANKAKYRENTKAISDKMDAEVKKQMRDKGLQERKHDTSYLKEYKVMKDKHKARQKAIRESKSRKIVERDSSDNITSQRSIGRFADTKTGRKLSKVGKKMSITAKDIKKTITTKAKPVTDAMQKGTSLAKAGAKGVKSRKRAIVANAKRKL